MTIQYLVQPLLQARHKNPPLETFPKMTVTIRMPTSRPLIRPPILNQHPKRNQLKQLWGVV